MWLKKRNFQKMKEKNVTQINLQKIDISISFFLTFNRRRRRLDISCSFYRSSKFGPNLANTFFSFECSDQTKMDIHFATFFSMAIYTERKRSEM